jgi:hypothetical protein
VLRVPSKIATVTHPRKSQNMVSHTPYFTGQHTQLGNPPFYAIRYVPPQHYFPRQTVHTGLYHLSKPPIRTFVVPTSTGSWNPRAATQPMFGSTYLQMHSPLVFPVLPPTQMNFQCTWPLNPPFPLVPTIINSHLQNNPAPTLLKKPDQNGSSSPDVGSPLACSSPSKDKPTHDSSADDSFLSQASTVLSDPLDSSAPSDVNSPISSSLSPQVDKETDVLDALLVAKEKIARLKAHISHPPSPAISYVSASPLIKPQPQKSAVLGGNTDLDEHLRKAEALRNKSTQLNKKSSELLLDLAASRSRIEKILDEGSGITPDGQETLLSMVENNQRLLSSLNQPPKQGSGKNVAMISLEDFKKMVEERRACTEKALTNIESTL